MIEPVSEGLVQGYLHCPEGASDTVVILAHGAGSDCNSRLLVAVASAFAERGLFAMRLNLPFRQQGRSGPPHPSRSGLDRDGLRAACEYFRQKEFGRIMLGGHSYGGRQATMLAAEEPGVADSLLLLSYPLHPPGKPEQLRTAHFPALRTPAVFVHGTRDPFGSPEEMKAVLPAGARLVLIEGAGHEQQPIVRHPERLMDALSFESV